MRQVNLFTSNFKRIGKRFLGAVLFFCIFMGIEKVMEFALVEDANEWSRAMFHDFYTREENIDFLYLGSSHVYCGLNPALLKEKEAGSHFVMATPAQPLNGSYYLLKEAVTYHDISKVYLELYFGQSTGREGAFKEADQLPRNWRNTNYMKPSFNKLSYMLSMSEPSLYYMTFLPARRYWSDAFEPEKIKETIRRKRTKDYADYYVENVLNGVVETYVEDGFYYSEHKAEGGVLYDITKPEPFSENPMTQEAQEYLHKIIKYCEQKGIDLVLYSAPVTDYQTALHENYDHYVNQVAAIAAEYGLPYYDFNLCKEEYLDVTDDGLFRDKGHLNVFGAEKFSDFFVRFFSGLEKGEITYEQCFYSSYKEKLSNGRKRILGLLIEKGSEKEETRTYTVTSVDNLGMQGVEYRIYTLLGEKKTMLRDWSDGAEGQAAVRIPKDYDTLVIEARPEGETPVSNTVRLYK